MLNSESQFKWQSSERLARKFIWMQKLKQKLILNQTTDSVHQFPNKVDLFRKSNELNLQFQVLHEIFKSSDKQKHLTKYPTFVRYSHFQFWNTKFYMAPRTKRTINTKQLGKLWKTSLCLPEARKSGHPEWIPNPFLSPFHLSLPVKEN